ncbi:MAG: DUF4926 domain-containing protein [Leptolyngbyaceae bacterium]|nr:DUF4926 domain-containing protein [Leptolyngbyaceae bacterium]
MKLQGTIIIPDAKLTQYLLIPRQEDDKSKFLAQAGFTQDNPELLKQAILALIQTHDATSDRQDKYGTYYRVEGDLIGSSRTLAVITVWIERAEDGNISVCNSKIKTMKDPSISLYSRISLNRDFPEYNLRRGDIATLIDTVPDPEGVETGYILEVFNALGESIDVVTVPQSAVVPLRSDEILSVRSLVQA